MSIFLQAIFFLFLLVSQQHNLAQNSFRIQGSGMSPTLVNGQIIPIDKTAENYERGDIVIFKYPKDQTQFFVKRIIGLPQESVQFKDASMYINGKKLDESGYLSPKVETYGKEEIIKLDNDEYYVLGDNRTASSDSRIWGPIKKELIIGKCIK